jgi:hypothetical protein
MIFLTLVALALLGCSKFMPAAMHHQKKTPSPAAAATSGTKQPAADHVVHKADMPAAKSPSKPATTPEHEVHSTTAADHKS